MSETLVNAGKALNELNAQLRNKEMPLEEGIRRIDAVTFVAFVEQVEKIALAMERIAAALEKGDAHGDSR